MKTQNSPYIFSPFFIFHFSFFIFNSLYKGVKNQKCPFLTSFSTLKMPQRIDTYNVTISFLTTQKTVKNGHF